MPKSCVCSSPAKHTFYLYEADQHGFVCPVDGTEIQCATASNLTSPSGSADGASPGFSGQVEGSYASGSWVRLLMTNGETVDLPREWLPFDVVVGNRVTAAVEDDGVVRFGVDAAEPLEE
jgi:hypothetical protein